MNRKRWMILVATCLAAVSFCVGLWLATRNRVVLLRLDGTRSRSIMWPGQKDVDLVGKGFTGTLVLLDWKGRRYAERSFANGKPNGRDRKWYLDGQLYELTTFVGGQKHGQYLRLFPNGYPFIRGYYLAGRKHGPWIEWYRDGLRRCTKEYEKGECRRIIWGDLEMDNQKEAILDYWRSPNSFDCVLRERVLRFVERGMAREEVRKMLGAPETEHEQGRRWKYVIAGGKYFDVSFDNAGKVESVKNFSCWP